jgi:hypothetical protein
MDSMTRNLPLDTRETHLRRLGNSRLGLLLCLFLVGAIVRGNKRWELAR